MYFFMMVVSSHRVLSMIPNELRGEINQHTTTEKPMFDGEELCELVMEIKCRQVIGVICYISSDACSILNF